MQEKKTGFQNAEIHLAHMLQRYSKERGDHNHHHSFSRKMLLMRKGIGQENDLWGERASLIAPFFTIHHCKCSYSLSPNNVSSSKDSVRNIFQSVFLTVLKCQKHIYMICTTFFFMLQFCHDFQFS